MMFCGIDIYLIVMLFYYFMYDYNLHICYPLILLFFKSFIKVKYITF